eukprot:m.10531 g.10531  ORF g.10531 m.10531 type:complete len:243 (-) comp5578_c0_seq2:192-920(-)
MCQRLPAILRTRTLGVWQHQTVQNQLLCIPRGGIASLSTVRYASTVRLKRPQTVSTRKSKVAHGLDFEKETVAFFNSCIKNCTNVLHASEAQLCNAPLLATRGGGDGGIDFSAVVTHSKTGEKMTMLGQCKNLTQRVSARVLREHLGVLHRETAIQQRSPVMGKPPVGCGAIVSRKGFAQTVIQEATLSNFPIVLITLPERQSGDPHVWANGKMQELGGLSLNSKPLGTRYALKLRRSKKAA